MQRQEAQTARSIFVPIVAFIITAIVVVFVINRMQVDAVEASKNHARNLVRSVSYNLQISLNEYFNITQFLRGYIVRHDGQVQDFQNIAESLSLNSSSIDSIQLAPDGIISYSHPMYREFEKVNLFIDSVHRDDAKYSRLTKLTTITGPFTLRRGDRGLSIHTPIYLDDANGTERFWGFAVITLRMAEIFREAHVSELRDENYDYQIKAINAHLGKLETVDCTTYDVLTDAVTHDFAIHNTMWTFHVKPQDGWINTDSLVLEILIGILFAIIVPFSVNSLWNLIRRESAFKRLTYVDTLTGLYNSRKFYEVLQELHDKKRSAGILYVDLNKFKPVNDTYGHKTGDELLSIVAKKLKNVVRSGDEVFRIGGDEFTIVVSNEISEDALSGLTHRIKESVARATTIGNAKVEVSASIGYARYPHDGTEFANIIQIAEEMMYADKKMMGEER